MKRIARNIFKLMALFFLTLIATSSTINAKERVDVDISLMQKLESVRVSVDMQNRTINEILVAICDQANINYAFDNGVTADTKNLYSLNVSNALVSEALDKLLGSTPYSFTIERERLIINHRSKTEPLVQQSQDITVRGKVLDAEGKPLAGATIISVDGGPEGAITDEQGAFTITLKSGTTVEVNFVGMLAQQLKLESNQDNLVITLQADELAVDDVIVTGLIKKPTSGFAGSVTKVTREQLQRVSTGNIFSTLSTIDASFKITENNLEGSNPNSLPDFTIRGRGSFQDGSIAPLFILDGFEVSAQKIFDMDINRIESITLLKDASATILYGSRASNGVVVIETASPQPGELRVTYDVKATIAFPDLSGYDLMDAGQKLEYERLAGLYEGSSYNSSLELEKLYYDRFSNVTRGVDTYWIGQPVTPSISQAHSLYVDGGVDDFRYGIDVSYNDTNGVMKESGRDRFNLGFALIYRIRNKITIRNYVSFSNVNSFNSPYGSFSSYALANPYEMPYDDAGNLVPLLSDGLPNPLYNASLPNRDNTTTVEFRDQLLLDWFINDNLRFVGQMAITKTLGDTDYYHSPYSSEYVLPISTGAVTEYVPIEERGSLTVSNSDAFQFDGNFSLTYDKKFGKHMLYSSLGAEMSTDSNSYYGFTATGFADDRYSNPAFAVQFLEDSNPNSDESLVRSVGFFGNLNYIYDERFFVDLSLRYDGSSNFGLNNRFAPFWSVGAGWNMHNESFIKDNTDIFNTLKPRYSYGVTGNQEFDAYQAKTMFEFGTSSQYDGVIPLYLLGYGNPDLKWQTQYQHNIGIDVTTANNRIRGSFEYYHKRTEGMLTSITVAPSIGLESDSYTANLGNILNKGYEANINGVIIRRPAQDLEWAVNLQATTNRSEIIEISDNLKGINDANNLDQYTPNLVYEEGQSLSAIKAVQSLGIDPNTGKELYLTKDNVPTYEWNSDDKIVAGDFEPSVSGNLSSNLQWKGWNLNMAFRYRFGADYYNQTLASRVEGANPRYNADVRVLNDRWKQPGDIALYKDISEFTTTYISTRFIQKEQLFEAGSMSLTYDFAKSAISKYGLGTLKVSLYANDLFRFSTIKQERGIDYPFQRSFVLGLNVSF